MIWGETGRPGYGLYDRALGAAYLTGLFEAVGKGQGGVVMGFRLAAFADEAGPSVEEQIRALREERIPLMELRGVDGRGADTLSEREAAALRARLEENGLRVWSPRFSLRQDGHPRAVRPGVRRLPPRARRGPRARHGAPSAVQLLYPRRRRPARVPRRGSWNGSRASRRPRAAAASRSAMRTKRAFTATSPVRCEQIHRAVPELRAVFDPANFIQAGRKRSPPGRCSSPYVEYFHVKDAMPDGTVVPAGRGAGHLAELLRGYRGETLTLEPHLYDFSGLSSLEQDGARTQAAGAYGDARASFGAGGCRPARTAGGDRPAGIPLKRQEARRNNLCR